MASASAAAAAAVGAVAAAAAAAGPPPRASDSAPSQRSIGCSHPASVILRIAWSENKG